jgi:hypothetical protein
VSENIKDPVPTYNHGSQKIGEVNPKPAIQLASSLLGFEGLIKKPPVLSPHPH